MLRLVLGILFIIICIAFLAWFNHPKTRRKMRDRQRRGRKTFERMSREEFGDAYSRLAVIPAGLGNIYIELNVLGTMLLIAGIGLIVDGSRSLSAVCLLTCCPAS